MLKPLLLLVLLALTATLPRQNVERDDLDLQVVKFSWAKQKQKSSVIRGAQNPGGSIATPISNDRDLGSRRVDMRNMEQTAAVSSIENPGSNYQLRLEVKNTGTNVVRGLVWEYKPTTGPDDYQPKQYLCALEVKPKEKKLLELWTPYAPVKMITADERSNALKEGQVIINQIEYADGSVWKRSGWNYKLRAGSSQKLAEGTCSTF